MRAYDAPTLTALAASGQVERGMIAFDFPSGVYGFWDGDGPITWNAITFQGGAQLIEIDAGEQSLAMDSSSLTLTLYANPDAGITSSVLRTIEAETYHQRPVTIYEAVFNADTRALISVTPVWRGYIDQVIHEIDPGGGIRSISARCESRSIDYTKRGWAMRSNAQQQVISAGDRGLEYTGIAGAVEVAFGRETTRKLAPQQQPGPVL